MFQVPQSYSIKQTIEPSYSSRLQNTPYYSNIPQATSPHSHSISSTSTLPLTSSLHRPTNTYSNVPSESNTLQYSNVWPASTSYIPNKNTTGVQNLVPKAYTRPSDVTYSNVHTRNRDGLIYSNLIHPPREGAVYSNMPPGGGYSNGGKFTFFYFIKW